MPLRRLDYVRTMNERALFSWFCLAPSCRLSPNVACQRAYVWGGDLLLEALVR